MQCGFLAMFASWAFPAHCSATGNLYSGNMELNQNRKLQPFRRDSSNGDVSCGLATQQKAPWGLASITRNEFNGPKRPYTYEHDPNGGEGVTVYVIGNSIYLDHDEFEGRASFGGDYVNEESKNLASSHGTLVAAVIAGKTYRVAKKTKIIGVKVFSNRERTEESESESESESEFTEEKDTSNIIKGFKYAIQHHKARVQEAKRDGKPKPKSIVNASVGISKQRKAIDDIVEKATESGLLVVAAAGNGDGDACGISPASSEHSVTVGGIDENYLAYQRTNTGKCVDIFAPAVDIISATADPGNPSASNDGTSLAAPHVAGIAAVILSKGDYSPQQLKDKIVEHSVKGALSQIGVGSPNRLAHIDFCNIDNPTPIIVDKKSEFYGLEYETRECSLVTQNNASIPLTYISQGWAPDNTDQLKYIHDPRGGEGVTVYIIESRAEANRNNNRDQHSSEGNASTRILQETGSLSQKINKSESTSQLAKYITGVGGVAKQAKLHTVYMEDYRNFSNFSDLINAILNTVYITHDVKRKAVAEKTPTPKSIILVNSEVPGSDEMTYFFKGIFDEEGILVITAAGAQGEDECKYSQAGSGYTLNVGSINIFNKEQSRPNYGKCVDIYAPGLVIPITPNQDNGNSEGIVETRIAAAYVAGVAAVFLSEGNYSPSQLRKRILRLNKQSSEFNSVDGLPKNVVHIDFCRRDAPEKARFYGVE